MTRVQFGMKFDKELMKRMDDAARASGLGRTEIFELAATSLLSQQVVQEAAAVRAARETRATVRRAYVCEKCKLRKFLRVGDPVPKCDLHGSTMIEQRNAPYLGRSV